MTFSLLDILFSTPLLQQESVWLFHFLGRLHPLFVHFPVSFLVLACILSFFPKRQETVNLLCWTGSITAVFAAIFGLLLASNEDMDGQLLDQHKYAGFFTAAMSLMILYQLLSKKTGQKLFRVTLILTTLGTAVAGHLGAELTHGENFLREVLPWNGADGEVVSVSQFEGNLSLAEQNKLAGEVRAVLAHNCYKCHGEVKQKGGLRLDEKEFIFKGGKNGEVISPGNAAKSELFRRITLPPDHKESMPSKGKSLTQNEIDLIELWINSGAVWPDNLSSGVVFPVADLAPGNPVIPTGDFENPIDLWVNDYFQKTNQEWKKKVSDRLFLRRVYLDVTGLLPTFSDIRQFEEDQNPDKRNAVVNKLLSRNDDYAQHWLTFWNDALRNDYTGTGYITNGRYGISNWLYTALQKNKPYHLFVKELLDPTEESKGFIEGIKWRGTINASQRTEMQAAQNVGQVLLGLNLKCASCHDSFVSNWKLEDAYAFANIFAEERLEIARCEKPTGKLAHTRLLWPSLGTIDSTASRKEKLKQLAASLVKNENGRLYRTLVNRVWAQLMGRGIVGTVDEMDNKPWSQGLLDWLAVNFVDNGYDVKKLIYLILTSDTYQMESEQLTDPATLLKDSYKFHGMITRRLTAEQFTDAVSQVFSPVFRKEDLRYDPMRMAGFIPTGNFIPRASLVANNSFLTALGRPNREIVTTSRPVESSLLQALELTNGTTLDSTLKAGAAKWRTRSNNSQELVKTLYREALGRDPSAKELSISLGMLGKNPSSENIQDLFWAVLLLPEFQLVF